MRQNVILTDDIAGVDADEMDTGGDRIFSDKSDFLEEYQTNITDYKSILASQFSKLTEVVDKMTTEFQKMDRLLSPMLRHPQKSLNRDNDNSSSISREDDPYKIWTGLSIYISNLNFTIKGNQVILEKQFNQMNSKMNHIVSTLLTSRYAEKDGYAEQWGVLTNIHSADICAPVIYHGTYNTEVHFGQQQREQPATFNPFVSESHSGIGSTPTQTSTNKSNSDAGYSDDEDGEGGAAGEDGNETNNHNGKRGTRPRKNASKKKKKEGDSASNKKGMDEKEGKKKTKTKKEKRMSDPKGK